MHRLLSMPSLVYAIEREYRAPGGGGGHTGWYKLHKTTLREGNTGKSARPYPGVNQDSIV